MYNTIYILYFLIIFFISSIEIVVDLLKQITTFLYIQDMLAKENMENRMQGKTYSYV